jgi:hypothetical protein
MLGLIGAAVSLVVTGATIAVKLVLSGLKLLVGLVRAIIPGL